MPSAELLRAYRRNAVHVRHALDGLQRETGRPGVDGGYVRDAGLMERYKRASIPVRRALNPHDRASFVGAFADLNAHASSDAVTRRAVTVIAAAWERLQQELDSTVG